MDDSTKGFIMLGVASAAVAAQQLWDWFSRQRTGEARKVSSGSSKSSGAGDCDCPSSRGKDIWRMDAVSMAAAIRRGDISAREAVQSALDRLAEVNPKLNAVVHFRPEEALALADEADRMRRAGQPMGPLFGLPVTIKEAVDQQGYATTNGIAAFRDLIAKSDCPAVRAWRKAGAIPIGRTNTPAFNLRWHTDNELHGRTFNPWDANRTPGGSSGGAASAVAAGIGALANGGDFGGSIRYPAYCNGVAGIRPSFGRVAHYNDSAAAPRPLGAQIMSVQGVIARTVADVRLGFRPLMSEADPRDPWWAPVPFEGPRVAGPISVAVPKNLEGMHPDVADAVNKAGEALALAGYAPEFVDIPSLEEASSCWRDIGGNEMRYMLQPALRQLGGADLVKAVDLMLAVSPDTGMGAYASALSKRVLQIQKWAEFMQTYPIVILPVSMQPPFEVGFDVTDENTTRAMLEAQRPQLAVSVLGIPSVSVPVGVYSGVPLGVQVVGRRWREDMCLDAAQVIERKCGVLTPIDPRF